MFLFPDKEHQQVGQQRDGYEKYLNPAPCLGATVVEKPQLAVILPVKRPFPTEQHPDKPEYEKSGDKEQRVTRMRPHPLEKQFNITVYGI